VAEAVVSRTLPASQMDILLGADHGSEPDASA
jgi:hypothetical protein